jgi:phosphoribosylaminoimidazole carboxylase PurE protein
MKNKKPVVGMIMGSQSDYPTMQDAQNILNSFEIPFEILVVSAHRTPKKMFQYAESAAERGIQVIIAGAGGSAHLPGMVACLTTLPVIGVPVETKSLKGLDSLLSIVQMPKGIPVATVAINNSENAALLALRILGVQTGKNHNQEIAKASTKGLKNLEIKMQKQVKQMNMFLSKLKKSPVNK